MDAAKKKPISKKKKILYGFLGFIAVCWLVATVGEILDPTVKPKEVPTPVQEVTTVFDIPSLLGKNVDQIKATLGSPLDDNEPTAQQLEFGAEEWQKEFKKSGYTLLVTYNPRTRVVLDFFMPTKDPSGLQQTRPYCFALAAWRNTMNTTRLILSLSEAMLLAIPA